MSAQMFRLGVVLSAITDRNLADKAELVLFARFMLDRPYLNKVDLRSAFDLLRPDIIEQQPTLAEIIIPETVAAAIGRTAELARQPIIADWLAGQADRVGPQIRLQQYAPLRNRPRLSFGA